MQGRRKWAGLRGSAVYSNLRNFRVGMSTLTPDNPVGWAGFDRQRAGLKAVDRPAVFKDRAITGAHLYRLSKRIEPINHPCVCGHIWKAHEQHFFARSQRNVDDRRRAKLHRLALPIATASREQIDRRAHRTAAETDLNGADERGTQAVVGEGQVDQALAVGGVVSRAIGDERPGRRLLHLLRGPGLNESAVRDHQRYQQRRHPDDEMPCQGEGQPPGDFRQSSSVDKPIGGDLGFRRFCGHATRRSAETG
jgi:hypothetical protein